MTFSKTFRPGDRVQLNGIRGFFRRLDFGGEAVVEWDGPGNSNGVPYDALEHAPVVVVGAQPAPPAACPDCGQPTFVDRDAEAVDPGTGRRRRVTVVACGFCEFVKEVVL